MSHSSRRPLSFDPPKSQEPALHRLWDWLSKTAARFCGWSKGGQTETWFICQRQLQAYMIEERILDILRATTTGSDTTLRALAREIVVKECVRVFTMLAVSNMGAAIPSFLEKSNDFCDKRLPYRFDNPAMKFPGGLATYKEIQKIQQHFCVEEMSERLDKFISEEVILPIKSKTPLDSGSSAQVFKIEPHEGYNSFKQRSAKTTASTPRSDEIFVLKTFMADTENAAECFDREVRAYTKLAADRARELNLIGYYGSFTVRDNNDQPLSYNIILEHADGRNLERFLFQDAERDIPTNATEFWAFWSQLFRLTLAIDRLHVLRTGDSDRATQTLRGMHHDLKPENILVLHDSENAPSDFPYRFVLADLGLVTLQTAEPGQAVTAPDQRATVVYGAPQTHRDSWRDSWAMEVVPAIDIWALGCIFSEAFVWSTLGYSGLVKYRRQRTQESGDFGPVFHDGNKVLPTVGAHHLKCVNATKKGDKLADRIAELLDQHLLVPVKEQLNAAQLMHKTQRILEATNPFAEPFVNGGFPEPPLLSATTLPHRPFASEPGTRAQSIGRDQTVVTGRYQSHRPSMNSEELAVEPSPAAQEFVESYLEAGNHLPQSQAAPSLSPSAQDQRPVASGQLESPHGPPPSVSVDQAKVWRERKRNKQATNLPQLMHLEQLRGRDSLFIIDDSKSMHKYWSEVKELLGILAYAAKEYDPDDLEYTFMSGGKIHKAHNSTKIVEKIQLHGWGSMVPTTNAQLRLDEIFNIYVQKYQNKRDRAPNFAQRLRATLTTDDAAQCRPITYYILTDAVWQPHCNVSTAILELLDKIKDARRFQVGISFIQFGQDEVGTNRLRALDDGMMEICRAPRDIVDYERSNGNVLKMLLGSISPWSDMGNQSSTQEREKWQWD